MRKNWFNIILKHKYLLLFILTSFIMGLEYTGVILIPFFKDWGGLNQFQIQVLQSWFMFWIFIMEIPTGMIGDKLGVKFSTLVGLLFKIIGIAIYVSLPNFYIFLLAEFTVAIGLAFISGAKEAWLYELMKEDKILDFYTKINTLAQNAGLTGMLISALTTPFVAKFLNVRMMFATDVLFAGIGLMLQILIKKPQKDVQKDLVPDYKTILREGAKIITKNKVLINDIIYVTILGALGYFVIWLNQTMMFDLGLSLGEFGIYRFIFLLAQIIAGFILAKYIDSINNRSKLDAILAVLVGVGYLIAGLTQNLLGLLVFLIITGGIGLQIRYVYSKELNKHIPSDKRATVLSMISMIKKVVLVILNPIVGALVDWQGVDISLGLFSFSMHVAGLYVVMIIFGLLGIIVGIKKFS